MKLSLVGSGNVAKVLGRSLVLLNDVQVLQILSRNRVEGKSLAAKCRSSYSADLRDLSEETNLCIICVNDDAIPDVAANLPKHPSTIYVHTSGSISSAALQHLGPHGVFYPLQTISAKQELFWNEIPVFITASNPDVASLLSALASKLGSAYQRITDSQRSILHLAAVIANNFSNALYHLATQIMEQHGLDSKMLGPLLTQGTANARQLGPQEAQTGPAIRGDEKTIAKHLHLLQHKPELVNLYQALTNLIQRQLDSATKSS